MTEELKKKTMKKLVSIVDRVSYLLSQKGLSQKDLATMLGFSEAYISDILNYKKQNLGLETIVKLESAFGEEILVNPDDFEESLAGNLPRLNELIQIANAISTTQKSHLVTANDKDFYFGLKNRTVFNLGSKGTSKGTSLVSNDTFELNINVGY